MDPDVASEHDEASFLSALETLSVECSEPDWDGYGAEPISGNTIQRAIETTRAVRLHPSWPTPAGEPDGGIGLEWYRSRDHACHVSVGPGEPVHYVCNAPGLPTVHGMLSSDQNGTAGLARLLDRYWRHASDDQPAGHSG